MGRQYLWLILWACLKIVLLMLHHIAWSCEGKSMLLARFVMKEFTVLVSLKEPDSNPWESWKMNWGLLLNMSWLSISCSPHCEEVSGSVLGLGYDSYIRWLLYYGGIELHSIALGLVDELAAFDSSKFPIPFRLMDWRSQDLQRSYILSSEVWSFQRLLFLWRVCENDHTCRGDR